MGPDLENVTAVIRGGSTNVVKVYLGSAQVWPADRGWYIQNGTVLSVSGAYSSSQTGDTLDLS